MIQIDIQTQHYFRKLIAQQGVSGLGIRLRAVAPGTPNADCKLEFCEPEDRVDGDVLLAFDDLEFVVDPLSAPYLEDAELSLQEQGTAMELTIRAPRLKAQAPARDAPLLERVQYVLDAEIRPGVASHGGQVSIVELTPAGELMLRFGGGCQGCGNADLTLKQGIEKTLRARFPEITAVRDITDHASGTAPYIKA